MDANQYWHVRALLACPKCSQPKPEGCLLCWPCHHAEKRENDGGYSEATEKLLAAADLEAKQ